MPDAPDEPTEETESLIEVADRLYAGIAEACDEHKLMHLGQVARMAEASEEDVSAAAVLDMMDLGLKPKKADRAIIAGVLTYQLCRIKRGVAEAALSPSVGEC